MTMKNAAKVLGVSYNIIYGKYREIYGPLNRNERLQPHHDESAKNFESLNITEYNDYTGTRHEFWEEHYVKVLLKVCINQQRSNLILSINCILQAVKEEEMAMDSAAELLGISHRILRKKFIEIYGHFEERKVTRANTEENIISNDFISTPNYDVSSNDENSMELDAAQDEDMYDLPSANQAILFDEDGDSEVVKDECGEGKEPKYYTTRSGRKTVQMVNQDNADRRQIVNGNTDWDEKQKNKIRTRQKKQGPSAEQLLAKEEDQEVLELQKAFVAGEKSWKEDSPKKRKGGTLETSKVAKKKRTAEEHDSDYDPESDLRKEKDVDYHPEGETSGSDAESDVNSDLERQSSSDSDKQIYKDLRDLVSGCHPVPFKVKRAGFSFDFNASPVEYKLRWRGLKKDGKRPCFSTIVGLKKCEDDNIDPRLLKFNGELFKARPLSWSLPQSVEEMNEHYNAVTKAYRHVLGFSEVELHCNKRFFTNMAGANDVEQSKDVPKKQVQSPHIHVKKKLSHMFRDLDKVALQTELEKRSEKFPADQRKTDTPTLTLKYDRCRLTLDQSLETECFEGLMVIAWHPDGQPIGKMLNFDDNKNIFIGILRDVWLDVRNRSTYKLPFSKHILSTCMSVHERVIAPKLLQQLLEGTAPSRICPSCGKVFLTLDQADKDKYDRHVKIHELQQGSCGCKEMEKIDTLIGMERHKKLHHGDGNYVECSVPKCPAVILKTKLDDHIKEFHMTNFICEECGREFSEKNLYQSHVSSEHRYRSCKICAMQVLQKDMKAHMIANHRGDPIPCPICGVKFADETNLARHKRTMHTAKDKKRYQCPYPECDKGFSLTRTFLDHLNNIHFNVYVYICEFNCPNAKYKDESNIRAHYRKKHGQKIQDFKKPGLEDFFRGLTEEERVYHESLLRGSGHYDALMSSKDKRTIFI